MKKLLVWALAILMVLGSMTAIAEEAADVTGTWYVNQVVMNKNAYANVAALGFKMSITLNEDGTGKIVSGDNETTGNCAWRANDDGTMTFMEEATQQPISMRLENNNLIIGAEDNYYLCGREQDMQINFAEVQTAEKAEDFDGTYALMYVSGDGFTMPVDNAMEDLRTIGLASTGVTIKDSTVELFGMEAQSYDFEGDGALKLVTNDGLEMTNVKIYKVDNNGIAINWLGLTFYAYPAE